MLHQIERMVKMASINVIMRARGNQNGNHPLQLRITLNRRSIRLNTGHEVNPKYWDEKLKRVKSAHPNSRYLNNYLQSRVNEIELIILNMEGKDSAYTLEMIKNNLKRSSDETVFKRGDEFFEELLLARKFNRYSGERAALNHLKRFREGQDLNFEDLNVNMLSRFKAYLLGEVGVSSNSVINYLITLRTIFNRAITDGVVDQKYYPFGKGKISLRRRESAKIGLDADEVLIFQECKLESGSYLEHAQMVWLFSFCFAGMRASDVLLLKWSNFKNGRLFYTMEKNTKSDSTEIPPLGQKILEFYSDRYQNNHNLVFPDLTSAKNINDKLEVQKILKYRIRKLDNALRDIQQKIGISKDITMHIARHTFGNIAGDKIPLQRLQQLYRHSSIETTLKYQKAFLYKGSDDALNEVLLFLNPK
jgi:integrase